MRNNFKREEIFFYSKLKGILMDTINKKILEAMPRFTNKQAAIGKYICSNIYDVALMNAAKIAKEVGVSEATITRFVYALGYNNFSDFQMDLRKQVQSINSHGALRQVAPHKVGSSMYQEVFAIEKNLLAETQDAISQTDFDDFVRSLLEAKNVILIGGPTQHYIVDYMADYLSVIKDRVFVANQRDLRFFGELGAEREKTIAVAFSYPRYPQEALRIVETVYNQNIPIIAITDSFTSPVVKYAAQTLITPLQYVLFVEPAASIFAFLHAVLTEMYRRDSNKIKRKFKKYEAVILSSDMFEYKDYDFTMKLE